MKKIILSDAWIDFIINFHQDCFVPEHLGFEYHMNKIWEDYDGYEHYLIIVRNKLENIANNKYTKDEILEFAPRKYFSILTPDLKEFFVHVLGTLREYLQKHPEIEQKYGKGRREPEGAGGDA